MKRIPAICQVNECGLRVRCKGLCATHYRRFLRSGDPLKSSRKRACESNNCGKHRCPVGPKITDFLSYLRNRQACIDGAIKWNRENPESHKKSKTAHRLRNKPHYAAYSANRKAKVRDASPPWLTNEHLTEMRSFYVEAGRLGQETGIPHHVDHVVPISGRTVCGLNVPWNLRVITKTENLSRPKIWSDDQSSILKGISYAF